MLLFEIKKILSRPLSRFVLLALAAVLVFCTFMTVNDVRYTDSQGVTHTGPGAARQLHDQMSQWSGYVTSDLLARVVTENNRINSTPQALSSDVTENNKAYSLTQGFSDIREYINQAFSGQTDYDYYRIDSVSPQEAGQIYERRISNMEEYLNSSEAGRMSAPQKDFLLSQYKALETPLYYEPAIGWNALLDSAYMPTLIMITVLITGFLVSGIFSGEFQMKSDAILFSSRLGRSRAVLSKIAAGLITTTAVYWAAVLLFSAAVLILLGAGGGGCAIQTGFGYWESFYNITFIQEFLITVLGGYVGTLFIAGASMAVSALSRSTVLAVTVPFILVALPFFIGRIDLLAPVTGLFPDQLLQISAITDDISLVYQVGGTVTGSIPLLFIIYGILFLALMPVLYRIYSRAEIR